MARMLRMPSEKELPPGSRRRFVAELFDRYKEADRPPLRVISATIDRHAGSKATASPETIRRMLNGTVVPGWKSVEAVLIAFCEMAGTDPDQEYRSDDINSERTTFRRELKYLWNRAVDFPDEYDPPPRAIDPWSTDEPPF